MARKQLNIEEADIEALAPDGRGGEQKYPWDDLKIGQAAVFDTEGEYKSAASSARAWAKKQHKKVSARRCIDGKFRIWRLA
jgi:hypothetical protein